MRGVARIVAIGFVALAATALSAQQNVRPTESGLWHLLQANESEVVIPQHRVDIRMNLTASPMRAAMVHRVTGEDSRPFSLVEFNGETLRLGVRSEVDQTLGQLVVLQMRWDGSRFVGRYVDDAGTPIPGGVDLKLVRASGR